MSCRDNFCRINWTVSMKKIITCLLFSYSICTYGQRTDELIKNILSKNETNHELHLGSVLLVQQFYKVNNYCLSWIEPGDSIKTKSLIDLIHSAGEYGLQPDDYTISSGSLSKITASSSVDKIDADLQLTDLFIQFLSDLKFGKKPLLKYDGIRYQPDYSIIPILLFQYSSHRQLNLLLEQIEPHNPEYKAFIKIIKQLWKQMHAPGFSEVIIRSNVVSLNNKPLVTKLFQFGLFDRSSPLTEKELEKKLRQAQTLLNVLSDGILRSTSLAELNVPISKRWQEACEALNMVRWFEAWKKQASIAILNIPSASLFVYYNDTLSLYSRIIVGKPTTPTPTLSSTISQIVVYPYWHVPNKIATKELLPLIKKNPAFLEANNFQVLSKDGKVLDAYSIPWQSLSSSNFPYTIRQSTGCDNALGLLKFEFYSPYSVYLYDTPEKGLFFLNKRYFSHGCMRIEEPLALAHLLLRQRMNEIDTLIHQCLKDQKPLTLKIEKPINFVVFYSTVWYTEKNGIVFYGNPYKK